MNYTERNEILLSNEFVGKVRIAYADWLGYWASAGTASIEDPDLREKTDALIMMSLDRRDLYVAKLATLVITEDAVKTAVEVTDANVKIAVDNVLAHAIGYLI